MGKWVIWKGQPLESDDLMREVGALDTLIIELEQAIVNGTHYETPSGYRLAPNTYATAIGAGLSPALAKELDGHTTMHEALETLYERRRLLFERGNNACDQLDHVQDQINDLEAWRNELGLAAGEDDQNIPRFDYSPELAAAMAVYGVSDPDEAWFVFQDRIDWLLDLRTALEAEHGG